MFGALPWLGTGAFGALAAAGMYGAGRLTQPPRSFSIDRPTNWGLPGEDVAFPSADGLELRGWLIPGAGSGAAVIVLHGYGGNRDSVLGAAQFLHPRFTVLGYDARGHGDSAGSRTSLGFLERLDVAGAVAFLRARGYGPIGLFGGSMGGATAIIAAAHLPEISAVVADCPFASLWRPIANWVSQHGVPRQVATVVARTVQRAAAWRIGCRPWDLDPVAFVRRIAPRPLLLIHGDQDTLIPLEDSLRLYAAAGEPRELWVLPGAGHGECYAVGAAAYRQRVARFFERALGS